MAKGKLARARDTIRNMNEEKKERAKDFALSLSQLGGAAAGAKWLPDRGLNLQKIGINYTIPSWAIALGITAWADFNTKSELLDYLGAAAMGVACGEIYEAVKEAS